MSKFSEKVAVKITEKGKHGCGNTLEIMRQEVGVMEKLDHPNIISLYEEIETLDKFYCILEYVDGESMRLFSNLFRKIVLQNLNSFMFNIIPLKFYPDKLLPVL